jgi:uncharacterized membrane protein
MRAVVIAGLLLAACGQSANAPSGNSPASASADEQWQLQTDGAESSLILVGDDGEAEIRLICSPAQKQLLVNVPVFDPVGSEERLSFGQGGEVVTLVADVGGDAERGGVTGSGAVPDNLVQLLSGRVTANYGSQNSGPHPTPPAALVNGFAAACTGERRAEEAGYQAGQPAPSPTANPASGSACLTGRDGRPLPANRIRAIGTEPFWGAQVEGRCVTYSTPENIDGTRVWTEFSGRAENGTWSGFFNDRPFVMRTRPQQGCSDGMSDKRYPVAVNLTVNGEQRTGCAEPR